MGGVWEREELWAECGRENLVFYKVLSPPRVTSREWEGGGGSRETMNLGHLWGLFFLVGCC